MKRKLDMIIRVMCQCHGWDISLYDEAFLAKSLDKRLLATGIKSAAAYGDYLSVSSKEAELFFNSLCIAYSEFFRNPLTFALLEQMILPGLIAGKKKSGQAEIRIWSAGCAAGQEAYSLAMLLDDMTAAQGSGVSFRLFATDRSEAELAAARQGSYDPAAVRNVKLKYLQKYFTVKGELYTIRDELKGQVDFSAYDLLDQRSGSPAASIYGDFDLVLCGNLLFYYRPEIRQSILNKVFRALTPDGYLATGEAERDIVAQYDGFSAVYAPAAIYKKCIH